MRRRVMLVGGWALATLTATTIGLLALGRVTDQVAPSQALPPPAASVALETPAPTVPAEAPSADAAEQKPALTEGYELNGGAVTVRYANGSAVLVSAAPSSGFGMDVKDRGPGTVDVRFRSDRHESRLTAQWRNGAPVVERDERER